jgi:hypothetical protein
VKRRDVRDVATEAETLFHAFLADTLVGTPLTDLGYLVTELDTSALVFAQGVDLGHGIGE